MGKRHGWAVLVALAAGVAGASACSGGAGIDPTSDAGTTPTPGSTTTPTTSPTTAGSDAAALPPPAQHRPEPVACVTVRDPGAFGAGNAEPGPDAGGVPDGGGGIEHCTVDSDCHGTNGRCGSSRVGMVCTYDGCFADSDCAAGSACYCGDTTDAGHRALPNRCLVGNCRTDADCGSGGYCSSSLDAECGAYIGVVGYFCRTPNDVCREDSDCKGEGGGICTFHKTTGIWDCTYGVCAG